MFDSYDIIGNLHTIRKCNLEDIPSHFSSVSNFIPEKEKFQYQNRMSECVKAGTAFVIKDGKAFLYYHKTNKKAFAVGVSMNGIGVPLEMTALFYGIFKKADTDVIFLRFALHQGKQISEYKSLLTPESIKRHKSIKDPVMVRVDRMLEKLDSLYSNQRNK
jgi:sorbitol-specific phosphotransferase system component IIC